MNTDSSPLVSIAFPIHKANDYYLKSLESLINQSYKSIEILLVDSSTQGISLPRFADNRIKKIKVPETFGLSASLNTAMQTAKGTYLARLDYDDVALPNRIMKQVEFLESNLEISIVGSWAYKITADDDFTYESHIIKRPLAHDEILNTLLYKNALLHPTIMLRLEDLRQQNLLYRKCFDSAEDFDLWIRASHKLKLANIPDPLVAIRQHEFQYSRVDRTRSEILASYIRFRHLIWMTVHQRLKFQTVSVVLRTILRHLFVSLKSYKFYRNVDKFDK